MNTGIHYLPARCLLLLLMLMLVACAPSAPAEPRPTAATILEITIAPTQDVDATATVYAHQLIPTPTPAGLYVVQRDDTLSGLAEDFGTTVEEIMAANGLTETNAIQVGQTLIIPSLISDTLPLDTATLATGTAVLTATSDSVKRTPTPTLSTP